MKKGKWVSVFAAATAIAAAAVAVSTFIKRKSEALVDHLDYDPDAYFDPDEELYGEEEVSEEETFPLFPEENAEEEADAVEEVTDDIAE